jgi:hypothetical protein
MNTKTILTQKLSNHFQMHPSRRKTFFGLIFGALTSNQVTHKCLSRHVISDNELAATRKVERFFQHQELPLSDYVETVISIFDLKEKLNLCIDRTNWSFGGKETNYLVVSCRLSKYISIPLFLLTLTKKAILLP